MRRAGRQGAYPGPGAEHGKRSARAGLGERHVASAGLWIARLVGRPRMVQWLVADATEEWSLNRGL